MRAPILSIALLAFAAPAMAQDVQGAPAAQDGAALFVEKCGMCHREVDRVAGMGTFLIARRDPQGDAMLEHRGMLTPEYISAAIRVGIGNMPRVSRAEVSDAQLAAISQYLVDSAAAFVTGSAGDAGATDPVP